MKASYIDLQKLLLDFQEKTGLITEMLPLRNVHGKFRVLSPTLVLICVLDVFESESGWRVAGSTMPFPTGDIPGLGSQT